MQILFVMPHQRHALRYELVLSELLARGHRVELGLKGEHHPEADELVARLAAGTGRLTRIRVPVRDRTWARWRRGCAAGSTTCATASRPMPMPPSCAPEVLAWPLTSSCAWPG